MIIKLAGVNMSLGDEDVNEWALSYIIGEVQRNANFLEDNLDKFFQLKC